MGGDPFLVNNINIYNSLKGFIKTKDNSKIIKIGVLPLVIQIYNQIIIKIICVNGIKPLIFYNIAYILGVFINLIFMKRLGVKRINIYININ